MRQLSITLQQRCQSHIESYYKSQLLAAAQKGDLVEYKKLVERIHFDLKTAHNTDQCDTIFALVYNYPLQNGNTALHIATNNGNIQFVEYLCTQTGILINASGNLEQSPLHMAAVKGNSSKITEMLLKNGANPNFQDYAGHTPLHRICSSWRGPSHQEGTKIIELLFQYGADSQICNNQDLKPHQMQNSQGHGNPIGIGTGKISVLKILIDNENTTGFQQYVKEHPGWDNELINDKHVLLYAMKCKQSFFESILTAYIKTNLPNDPAPFNYLLQFFLKNNCTFDTFRFLVKKGGDANCVDKEGNTLLHLAAHSSIEVVNYLVEWGLLLTRVNKAGQTPEQMKRTGILNVIVEHKKAILRYFGDKYRYKTKLSYFTKAWLALNYDEENRGATLIHFSAAYDDVLALKELKIIYGNDWATAVNKRQNNSGGQRTPLAFAVRSQSTAAIKYLLENGADHSITCVIDEDKSIYPCTPFAYCLARGWKKEAELFLTCNPKPDLNQTFDAGNKNQAAFQMDFKAITPLHVAIQANFSEDFIFKLVKAGADVSVKYQGKCAPFQKARDQREISLEKAYIKFLGHIKAGNVADLIIFLNEWKNTWLKVEDASGQTPLHHAVLAEKPAMVEYLLSQNVNKNVQDTDGNTPYHLAIKSGNQKIIAELQKASVDKTIKNKKGETPEEVGTGFFGWSKNPIQLEKEKFESAVHSNNIEIAKKLFAENPALLHDQPKAILTLALEGFSIDLFQFFAEACIKKTGNDDLVKQCINQPVMGSWGSWGSTYSFAQIIAWKKRWDLADWCHQHGADFNQDASGNDGSPLWVATHLEDLQGVQVLLSYEVDVNVGGHNKNTATPLMNSVSKRTDQITELLLCAGADTARYRTNPSQVKLYAHGDEDSSGYLHQKAKLIFDIITTSNMLLLDIQQLSELKLENISNLTSFKECANKIILPEWIGKYHHPQSIDDIFTHEVFKVFFKTPFLELQTLLKTVNKNNEEYKKARVVLLKSLVDPLLARANTLFTGGNRQKMIKEGLESLKNLDQGRFKTLGNYYNDFVVPFLQAINEKNWPINTDQFNYVELSAAKCKAIFEAVPTLEKNFAQLEKDFAEAVQAIYKEQKEAYKLLAAQIKEFNDALKKLPGQPSTSLQNCLLAIKNLLVLEEATVDNPSIQFLSDNKKNLEYLQKNLPISLVELANAEKKHADQEKAAEQQAEKLKQEQAVKKVQNQLQVLNDALDRLRPLWRKIPPTSPLINYWVLLLDTSWPEKDYYSAELKLAIQTIRKNYQTIALLLQQADNSGMPSLPKDFETASALISSQKVDAFQQAAQELKTSAEQFFPLLSKALEAEVAERNMLAREAKLRVDLNQVIQNINSVCSKILVALGEKPFVITLDALAEFRLAIGCVNKDLTTIIPNTDSINKADEKTLQVWALLANAAQSLVDTYHQKVDRENAEKEQQRRAEEAQKEEKRRREEEEAKAKLKRESDLREKISAAVQTFNPCLRQIKVLISEEALDPTVLQEITTLRAQLECTAKGVEPIVPKAITLSEAKEIQLNTCLAQAQKAQLAATHYLQTLQTAQKTVQEKTQREIELRKNLFSKIPDLNKQLRILEVLQGKTVFIFTCTETLAQFRINVGCTNKELDEIQPSNDVLSKCGEEQLIQLQQSLASLTTLTDNDRLALRERNKTQLLSAISELLSTLNATLATFSKAANQNTALLPANLLSSIQTMTQQISAQSTQKPFEPLSIDNKKAEGIPPEKHQAIADELERITAELNKAQTALEEKKNQAQRKEGEKQDALSASNNIITTQLNPLVTEVNLLLTQGEKLLPSLVSELNTFNQQLEAPQSAFVSFFSSKPVSTETQLQTIAFDQKYCAEQYTTEQLKQQTQAMTACYEKLKTALENLRTLQGLKAQLKEVHQKIETQIKLLPPEEIFSDTNTFITLHLTPAYASSDIPFLTKTLKTAQENLRSLTERVQKLSMALKEDSTEEDSKKESSDQESAEEKGSSSSSQNNNSDPQASENNETIEELREACSNLHKHLVTPLKSVPDDKRHTQFKEQVTAIKAAKEDPIVLKKALSVFNEIAKTFELDVPSPSKKAAPKSQNSQSSKKSIQPSSTTQNVTPTCANFYEPLKLVLKEQTHSGDSRRKKFTELKKKAEQNQNNPEIQQELQKEFHTLACQFFSDRDVKKIESGEMLLPSAVEISPQSTKGSLTPSTKNQTNKSQHSTPQRTERSLTLATTTGTLFSNEISESLLAALKQDRQKVIDLLETFKHWTLDGPRYALKYHFKLLNENGGLTPEEFYHLKSLIGYLDGINETVKKEIDNIKDSSANKSIDYTKYTKIIIQYTKEIEGLLLSLAQNGTADYKEHSQDSSFFREEKAPIKNLHESNPGFLASIKRSNLATQTTPHPQSPVGVYNNLLDLFSALSSFITDKDYTQVKPKIWAFNSGSSQQYPTTPVRNTNG